MRSPSVPVTFKHGNLHAEAKFGILQSGTGCGSSWMRLNWSVAAGMREGSIIIHHKYNLEGQQSVACPPTAQGEKTADDVQASRLGFFLKKIGETWTKKNPKRNEKLHVSGYSLQATIYSRLYLDVKHPSHCLSKAERQHPIMCLFIESLWCLQGWEEGKQELGKI